MVRLWLNISDLAANKPVNIQAKEFVVCTHYKSVTNIDGSWNESEDYNFVLLTSDNDNAADRHIIG